MSEARQVQTLEIDSDPARIREVRLWLQRVTRGGGWTEAETRDLALAATEACSNAYRYGYACGHDGRIALTLELDGAWLRLTVRDYGAGFDPAEYRPPAFDLPREGGYGLYLMRELTDRLVCQPMEPGTRVVLEKTRRTTTSGDDDADPGKECLTMNSRNLDLPAREPLDPELRQLCRLHGIDEELAHDSEGVEGLIQRVLEQCERDIEAEIDEVAPARPERLRSMVRFASQATALRNRPEGETNASSADTARMQADLEQFVELMKKLGMMCHQINNPLTALMGRSQILKMRGDTDPNVKKAADVIEDSAKRVAELIREMAHVVRQGREDAIRAAGASASEEPQLPGK